MCGIAGIVDRRRGTAELASIAGLMAAQLRHRGPDDAGSWSDDGVALGHTRLSIIDLSVEGHQPMVSESSRFVLSYNGEIYNHQELRRDLERSGQRFRGTSDTEVLLGAIERWGLREALRRSNGMFALALYDTRDRVLQLARDRLGEKPLFWGWFGSAFVFASELRAIVAPPDIRADVDRDALVAFLRHGYVPEPRSIYKQVSKLPPSTIATLAADAHPGEPPVLERYWHPEAQAGSPRADAEAVDALDSLLRSSVEMRMVADVPVGAFLSGGIDSSAVVALMQRTSSETVRTFSVGFAEPAYDEAPHAAAVAAHLGTDHTELYVSPEDARAVIPRLPSIYGEPFADASQIPTFLVAQLARHHVTVSLSGDGGDELFGGYERYAWGRRLWSSLRRLPEPLRRGAAAIAGGVSPAGWDRALRIVPVAGRRLSGNRIARVGEIASTRDPAALYLQVLSHTQRPAALVRGGRDPVDAGVAPDDLDGFTRWMSSRDLGDYLPGDILTKVDRATMAVSLEARVPLLDHRVVDYAVGLPVDQKIRGSEGKWILRQVLDRYVPRELVERPKMGFGVPIGEWIRGPLRSWADDLLDADRLDSEGFFEVDAIRRLWQEHLTGSRDWQYVLWDVLMFEGWLAEAVP